MKVTIDHVIYDAPKPVIDALVNLEHQRDAARAEVARLRDELATVLEVAIARGGALGYDSDSDYIQRWEELTGDEWVEE